jgi:hypothetical protein
MSTMMKTIYLAVQQKNANTWGLIPYFSDFLKEIGVIRQALQPPRTKSLQIAPNRVNKW